MKHLLLSFLAMTLFLASSVNVFASVPKDWVGQKFVDFIVDDGNPDGTAVRLSDYVGKGKYVIVDFWASWCAPCKGELPNLKEVYEKYGGDDFTVVSVAVWDKRADSEKTVKSHGMTWPQILNSGEFATKLYGIKAIPQIMMVGPDGTIVEWNLRGDAIETAVSKYVKAKK
ncbi:MAG: TlpA family protein disulfide reductase [Alistipes sp.]|nr:TlpA family protein disulfide reductase [Candidatus Minthomonas equi]